MDKVFHLTSETRQELGQILPQTLKSGNLVLLLCAGWCGTCASFEDVANDLQARFPEALFIWLDIEDDSVVAGDVDISNFPTLTVFRSGVPVHYGVSLPHQGVVKRLLTAVLNNPIRAVDAPDEVLELPQKLLEWLDSDPQSKAFTQNVSSYQH